MREQEYIGIIEVEDSCFTIVKEGKDLVYGTVCNVGLLEHGREEIDTCFDFNTNLSSFLEIIEEENRS